VSFLRVFFPFGLDLFFRIFFLSNLSVNVMAPSGRHSSRAPHIARALEHSTTTTTTPPLPLRRCSRDGISLRGLRRLDWTDLREMLDVPSRELLRLIVTGNESP
jgi:hypothetical protein